MQPKKQKIHFIAIGGSVMHSLAIALQAAGHHVTGSDDEVFEPSRSTLAKYGLLPEKEGWAPEKLAEVLPAMLKNSLTPFERTGDVFSWDVDE